MKSADHAYWQSIATLAEGELDAYLADVPADAPLVDAVRTLRSSNSQHERADAIRARDRAFRDKANELLAANRDWRPPIGAGRCKHGKLLEDCVYPSCARDIGRWTQSAMGRHRAIRRSQGR